MAHKYVSLPPKGKKVYLYRYDSAANKLKKARQVLWGDYLRLKENHTSPPIAQDYIAINWSPKQNPKTYYIHKDHISDERPLEIIFLDVGQGDGAVLISSQTGANERISIIDAGEGDNMLRFIMGRFKAYRGFRFDNAILTHPDMDHYQGFLEIFKNHRIAFNNVYHNGIVERPVSGKFEKVGGLVTDTDGSQYIESLAETKADLNTHFADATTFGRYKFPPVIHAAMTNPRIADIKMMSTHSDHCKQSAGVCYLPGYAPQNRKGYTVEVLGPIVEEKNGKKRLKKIADYGKTKNGHSILLRMHIGKFKILFGGDLNKPAEKYLLQHYTGRASFPQKGTAESAQMIADAKHWFEAEVMKVCHHGASDVTDEFMSTVNPACFVISSGDSEGHVHPRPDLLGRLGKFGRGDSPVLLSTELQRSTRERDDQEKIDDVLDDIDNLTPTNLDTKKTEITKSVKELTKSNIDVYGAIYLKTDGDRLITAFKIESGSSLKKWFYYEYELKADGELKLC